MTSVAVPDNDLAPNMPSREVTISATNITEGGVSLRGQWVNFRLSDTVDVIPGGDNIAMTSVTITLDSAGNGRVRLPVYDTSHGKGWGSGKDWMILVTTSWGSAKAIRVPAGSGSIPLSQLPTVRPLTRAEMRYAVTGVGITVGVGSTPGQAAGTATLDGGILRLGLTVPPTGPHTHPTSDINGLDAAIDAAKFPRGRITSSASLTGLTPGIYTVSSMQYAEMVTGLPEVYPCTIVVNGNPAQQVRSWEVHPHDRDYFYTKNSGTGQWIRHDASLLKGRITTPVTLTDLDPGTYTVSSVSYAGMVTGIPEVFPSTIVVSGNPEQGVRSWAVYPHDKKYFYTQQNGGNGPTGWVKHTGPARGRPANGSDVLKLETGTWTISSAGNAASMTNLPEAWPGVLRIEGDSSEPLVNAATFRPYQKDYIWETVSAGSGTWGPWRKVTSSGGGSSAATVDPYAAHTIRQTQMMYTLGGPLATGKVGAFSWRIDHGWKNFKEKLLPIFRAAGIVPMVTYNPRDWTRSENDGVTAADVNTWVQNGWIVISNHAASHTSASGNAAIFDQIATGLSEIESQIPAAAGKVYGFCVAGSGGYTDDTGAVFTNGASPEQWDSYAGKLILKHHAVGYGYLADTNPRILDGTIRDGVGHLTTDSVTVATIKAQVDTAISQKRGLQLMTHPSLVDASGYNTTAMVQEVVDYVVAKQTAGQIKIMSPYQMMVADSRF